MLRSYQQEAVDAVIEHCTTSTEPCLVSSATGSGKSHIIAALATYFGRVLCLAPVKELVSQNFDKYQAVADNASIFCAGLGRKDATGQVVYASPQTVINNPDALGVFDAIIVDEAHRAIDMIAKIIAYFRALKPDLHSVGLSATPYTQPTGYIYRVCPDGRVLQEDEARDPFYAKCVYEIKAQALTDAGWLTPITLVPTGIEYDTSRLVISRGRFTDESVEEAFLADKDLTRRIIRDVERRSANRRGVMVFAASVAHAREILGLLPRGAKLVTGDTPKKERDLIVSAFRCGMVKYLVNVAVFTTGFDVPHLDHIAIMRGSESASLWQQIAGRGLRLFPGKDNCLISDYAGNIERFFGDDRDLFSPIIRARKEPKGGTLSVICPACAFVNKFAAVPNPNKLSVDSMGRFVDLAGDVIYVDGQAVPAHHGRRCQNHYDSERGELLQCDHRWAGKRCKRCGTENDIAARECTGCGNQLVDWNARLNFIAGNRTFIVDDHGWKQAKCTNAHISEFWHGRGKMFRCDFTVEGRKTPLTKFFHPKDPSYFHFVQRAKHGLPALILWKARPGKNYPAVKLQWGDNAES